MLTDIAARNAKPSAKPQRVFDSGGLYLEVAPNGAKYWRLKYRFASKEKRLALGVYPEVSLTAARTARDVARGLLRDGIDPSAERKARKERAIDAQANCFGEIKREWMNRQTSGLAHVTVMKTQWLLDLAAPLDGRPIRDIEAPEVLRLLNKIQNRGTIETAHRVKQRIGAVLRYAVATGRADRDITVELRGALSPVVSTSRAAVTDPADVRDLLMAIEGFSGQPTTHAALKLAPLLFVRPGNLRAMEWAELHLDGSNPEWRIPAGKMKMREAHVVPLPTQSVAILCDLRNLTGRGSYCFPSLRTGSRPMSENTINAALRRMGYAKDQMTAHGFRAMASTRLNELGWAPDVIERQLAHAERNKVRAAYNRAQYLAERRKMMQAWADYLDTLRDSPNKIVPIKRAAANRRGVEK